MVKITVVRNAMGHVHVFKEKISVSDLDFSQPYNIRRISGGESDLYLQTDYDIDRELGGIESCMSLEQLNEFRAGFPVVIEDPGYFGFE